MQDLTAGFEYFLELLGRLVALIQTVQFQAFGITVSLWGFIVAGIVITLVCAVFWKGAAG